MAHIRRIARKTGTRYEVRYQLASGTERAKTFRTRREADAFIAAVTVERNRGTLGDPAGGRITFEQWWDRWWPTRAHLRASTKARDEAYFRHRVKPHLGDVRLDRLDRERLREWIAILRADDLAPATITKAAQIVSTALRAAVDDGRIGRNPAERLELPKIEAQEMRFLTPPSVNDLADAIDPMYRALVILGAYGGLRIGEIAALRRDRIDLLHARVDVRSTLAEVRGLIIEQPPKTRRGRRVVPVPRVVVDALDQHLAEHPAEATDYLFSSPLGGALRVPGWRRRAWQPACVRAGVGELIEVPETGRKHYIGLRPHDLRHTAVALWIAAGASPKEIADRAGHSSVVTVLDRYGHLLPGSEDKVNLALDALASGSIG